jgi:hypothetical protein
MGSTAMLAYLARRFVYTLPILLGVVCTEIAAVRHGLPPHHVTTA